MLSVENLNVAIDNIKILNSVSLNVEKFSSIIGRNGAGKTTLIRSIMSILAASSGKINFNGSDLTKIKTNSHFLKTLFDLFNFIKMPHFFTQLP